MNPFVAAIEYFLPRDELSTTDLSNMHLGWCAERIDAKTGIKVRHIASRGEYASDLAFAAVDFLILSMQTSDYSLPTTACLLRHRLGLATSVGALDLNLGCSGFVYGLGLAKALIISGQAKRLLLVTANTYSKYIDPDDRDSSAIFGDGASATLVVAGRGRDASIGPFLYCTDGSGALDIVALNSGTRTENGDQCRAETCPHLAF